MHLASDYIHKTPRNGQCRMRIYLSEEELDAPIVICSELPHNEGSSVTSAVEQLAAEVVRYNKLSTPMVWIEHYPPECTDGRAETFKLVIFSSYEVIEGPPYLGKTKLSLGEPTWKALDRRSVETLTAQEV